MGDTHGDMLVYYIKCRGKSRVGIDWIMSIKYMLDTESRENLEQDSYGNTIDKYSGQYVIIVPRMEEKMPHQPATLTKVDGQWVPKQMELWAIE